MKKEYTKDPFIHEKILKILKTATPEKPIQKERIREILLEDEGLDVSRGNLNSKFADLEEKGIVIIKTKDGFYVNNDEQDFTDGELRMIADSVLYSGVVSSSYAADIISRLGEKGSAEFAKYMEKRAKAAKILNRTGNSSIIIYIEDIQNAIVHGKQISCNIIEYDRFFEPVRKYDNDIVVDPYELAFSGGKYYLVCAVDGNDELTMLRVDRLVDVELLESNAREIQQIKNIRNDKGMQKYIYSQPELKGGQKERFTLLCYRDSLNDVYDAFDGDLRIRNDIEEDYDDPDTVRVSVETTHDAMIAWAVTHADSVVVIYPKSVREEIEQVLKAAEHTYFKTGLPASFRSYIAHTIDEALREARIAKINKVSYTGRGKIGRLEKLDIGRVDLSGMQCLHLWACDITESRVNGVFTDVEWLLLTRGKFSPEIFVHFPNLNKISIAGDEIDNLEFIKQYKSLIELRIIDCNNISDFTPLFELDELKCFITDNVNFTEELTEKLCENFPDCTIKIEEPLRRRK